MKTSQREDQEANSAHTCETCESLNLENGLLRTQNEKQSEIIDKLGEA